MKNDTRISFAIGMAVGASVATLAASEKIRASVKRGYSKFGSTASDTSDKVKKSTQKAASSIHDKASDVKRQARGKASDMKKET